MNRDANEVESVSTGGKNSRFADTETHLRAIIESTPECVKLLAADGALLDMNPAGLRMLEADSLVQVQNQCVYPIVADEHREAFRELTEKVFRGESGSLEFEIVGLKGTRRWLETHASPFRDASGCVIALLGVTRDVSARHQSEALLAGQKRVFEMIATGAPLAESLAALVRLLEAHSPEMLCSILLLDADGIHLRLGAAPNLPEEYARAMDGATVESQVDSCCATVFRREPVFVADLAADPLWKNCCELAEHHSLRACWCVPIFDAQRTMLGMFAIHFRQSSQLGERDQQLVHVATHIAAIAIGRQREENALRLSQGRFAAFSSLGEKLSSAKTAKEAGEIIVEVADQLFGWDACTFDLYSGEEDLIHHVLNRDCINGQRVAVEPAFDNKPPRPLTRRVLEHGAELILRDQANSSSDAVPFGDKSRLSASLMFVPIRHDARVVGVVSIQSYSPKAYTPQDLETLQSLADHCGGALNRIQAEEAFRVSEGQFRSVWERSVDGMRLTDATGCIIAVNEAFCEMVGLSREKLTGQVFSIAYGGHGASDGIEVYHRRFAAGDIVPRLTARVKLWDARELDLEISNSFIEFGPQGRLLLSIFRDITERKKIEEQFRQAQKMEAFGQLAGGVAHDFNNILSVIIGYTNLLMLDEKLEPATRKQLKEIFLAGERAANLTRQLLTFSRKKAMQVVPLDVNGIISNITRMLGRVIGEDIKLQCNFASNLPAMQADQGMIEQVLMNLAINARDAMPSGGQLIISTNRVVMDAVTARDRPSARVGEFISLTVQDNGCGMTPEVKARIFEPFFTTKDVGRGTGLGLATVYGIIEQHGGWIEVESEAGAGTKATIFLPTSTSATAATSKPAETSQVRGGKETVLLVEDEAPLRGLTRVVLQRQGYVVIEAASGVDALAVWEKHGGQFDLLLTDMIMPDGVTGRELARKLCERKPGLKVIFTSGYNPDMAGADAEFIRQSKGRFLQKPYTPEVLLQAIRAALDH